MKGTAVLAHSGGPTPVINASLLGVVEEARRHPAITGLYGAEFGIDGILAGRFIDLFRESDDTIAAIARTPSSSLGTSRREVNGADLERLLEVFHLRDVRYFLYNGGNGSMGTAHEIQKLADRLPYDLNVIGIPKTIDNDLLETDHTPGYGSTARFFALALRDIGMDNRALPGQVEFVEVLGRNAGWIVAGTALARSHPDDAPHLIYFPEQRLSLHKLCADIEAVYRRLNRCVIAVCEGQLDEQGGAFGADSRSGSRGTLAMNLAHRLTILVSKELGIRTRSEKPGLLGRATATSISEQDWHEARLCGAAAVKAAASGKRGEMVTLVRESDFPYSVSTGLVKFERVAFVEKLFPAHWRNEASNDVTPAFLDYAMPLVGPIPKHARLKADVVF